MSLEMNPKIRTGSQINCGDILQYSSGYVHCMCIVYDAQNVKKETLVYIK